MAQVRLVNRKFANAGYYLMLRWTTANPETFHTDLTRLVFSNFAKTVRSIQLDRGLLNIPANLSSFVIFLSGFTNLTHLDMRTWNTSKLSDSAILCMLIAVKPTHLTHLTMSAAYRDPHKLMPRLSSFETERSMPSNPEWNASEQAKTLFSSLRYLPMHVDPGTRRNTCPNESKAVLFISSLADNAEVLRLQGPVLDVMPDGFQLARNKKLRIFSIARAFMDVNSLKDILGHKVKALQIIENQGNYKYQNQQLELLACLLEFSGLEVILESGVHIEKRRQKFGAETKDPRGKAFEKLVDHVNINRRRRKLPLFANYAAHSLL